MLSECRFQLLQVVVAAIDVAFVVCVDFVAVHVDVVANVDAVVAVVARVDVVVANVFEATFEELEGVQADASFGLHEGTQTGAKAVASDILVAKAAVATRETVVKAVAKTVVVVVVTQAVEGVVENTWLQHEFPQFLIIIIIIIVIESIIIIIIIIIIFVVVVVVPKNIQ